MALSPLRGAAAGSNPNTSSVGKSRLKGRAALCPARAGPSLVLVQTWVETHEGVFFTARCATGATLRELSPHLQLRRRLWAYGGCGYTGWCVPLWQQGAATPLRARGTWSRGAACAARRRPRAAPSSGRERLERGLGERLERWLGERLWAWLGATRWAGRRHAASTADAAGLAGRRGSWRSGRNRKGRGREARGRSTWSMASASGRSTCTARATRGGLRRRRSVVLRHAPSSLRPRPNGAPCSAAKAKGVLRALRVMVQKGWPRRTSAWVEASRRAWMPRGPASGCARACAPPPRPARPSVGQSPVPLAVHWGSELRVRERMRDVAERIISSPRSTTRRSEHCLA